LRSNFVYVLTNAIETTSKLTSNKPASTFRWNSWLWRRYIRQTTVKRNFLHQVALFCYKLRHIYRAITMKNILQERCLVKYTFYYLINFTICMFPLRRQLTTGNIWWAEIIKMCV